MLMLEIAGGILLAAFVLFLLVVLWPIVWRLALIAVGLAIMGVAWMAFTSYETNRLAQAAAAREARDAEKACEKRGGELVVVDDRHNGCKEKNSEWIMLIPR